MNTKERMARAACPHVKPWIDGTDVEYTGCHCKAADTPAWRRPACLLVSTGIVESVFAEQMEISAEVKAVGDEARMEEKPADYIYRAMTQAILEGK